MNDGNHPRIEFFSALHLAVIFLLTGCGAVGEESRGNPRVTHFASAQYPFTDESDCTLGFSPTFQDLNSHGTWAEYRVFDASGSHDWYGSAAGEVQLWLEIPSRSCEVFLPAGSWHKNKGGAASPPCPSGAIPQGTPIRLRVVAPSGEVAYSVEHGWDDDVLGAHFAAEPCNAEACSVDADCDDGAYCNGVETCQFGRCQTAAQIDCSSLDDACSAGVCSEATESCEAQAVADGTPCADDGLECTADRCDNGVCSHPDVPDGTECALGLCAAGACLGCSTDADCDDGAYCNGVETCQSGRCQAGVPIDCSDFAECTQDICDEANAQCDNPADPAGTSCAGGGGMCDGSGSCQLFSSESDCTLGFSPTFQDLNRHGTWAEYRVFDASGSHDWYGSAAGEVQLWLEIPSRSCEVFLPAGSWHKNKGDAASPPCPSGAIPQGTPVRLRVVAPSGEVAYSVEHGWDDDVLGAHFAAEPCNAEACSVDADCDDGAYCNGVETCQSGRCQTAAPIDCSSLDDVCSAGVCSEATESCETQSVTDGTPCTDDGLECTGDTCDKGVCSHAHLPDHTACSTGWCESGECADCTGEEGCNPGTSSGPIVIGWRSETDRAGIQ